MKNVLIMMFSIVINVFLGLVVLQAHGEVTSCQTYDQGTVLSCMEFASGKPIPASMEKICAPGNSRSSKWVKSPCPRAGSIGYCQVPRHDTITQVVYCYKRQGMPDKQKIEFCKQACKGRFAAY